MPPVDIRKLFDQDLPPALAKAGAKATQDLGGVFHIIVTGRTPGEWVVDGKSNPATVRAGKPGWNSPPDVAITISDVDFQALVASPVRAYTAWQMFSTGKIRVQGQQALAPRLDKLLGYMGK